MSVLLSWDYFKLSILFFMGFMLIGCTIDQEDVLVENSQTQGSDDITELIMIDNNNGVAVGGDTWNRGVALTTQDGGAQWTTDSIINKKILGLDYFNEDFVCVGIDGYFLKSEQSINSWKFHRLAFWDVLRDVVLTPDGSSIAVGGAAFHKGLIYHITNENSIDSVIRLDHELRSVTWIGGDKYIAVGFGAIYISNDAGYGWQLSDVNGDFYQSVDFLDDKNGMIVGEAGSILRTRDGGENWENIRDGNDIFQASGSFRDILMINKNEICIVGDEGLIWKSDDSGDSWIQLNTDNTEPLSTLSYTDSHIIVGGKRGYIYRFPR